MKRSLNSRRTPSNLPALLHQRLSAYALAAGAAGVGVITMAQPLDAEIVYTPANQIIGRNGSYKLDLNHDGITDFDIIERPGRTQFGTFQALAARASLGNNQVNCETSFCGSYPFAAALRNGSRIGPNATQHGWLASANMAFEALGQRGTVYYGDPWVNVSDRYLGLRFQINGETHYGWARLSVKFRGGSPMYRTWKAHLTGYAYETIANRGIFAGQTTGQTGDATESTHPGPLTPSAFGRKPVSRPAQFAAIGTLALGADGISLWRREESESDVKASDNGAKS